MSTDRRHDEPPFTEADRERIIAFRDGGGFDVYAEQDFSKLEAERIREAEAERRVKAEKRARIGRLIYASERPRFTVPSVQALRRRR